jgi:alkylation response protein AidB-like acyl-CoA dehydrogenase
MCPAGHPPRIDRGIEQTLIPLLEAHMTATIPTTELLTEELLARFDERAPIYDREHRFFQEDFEELRDRGYLLAAVPTAFGGAGLTFAEVQDLQRRLAYVAPATALAVNMHFYWTGVAAQLSAAGDPSCEWMLRAAADGAVFAAGHGEAGNDIPVLLSSSAAERVDGGWEITGHKIFGSLSPVWTFLGVHALDTSDPENLRVVHAFVPRDAERYTINQTWDVLGMRATESNDTILDHTFVPDEYIALVCPAGFAGAQLFQLSIFAWGLLGFATVYRSIAQRAYDETVRKMHQRKSVALTRSMAYHPGVQHEVAEMRIALEAMDRVLDGVVSDWSNGVDHGHDWVVKIVGSKYFVVNEAWKVVDAALDLSGGSGIFTRDRMQQLFRDARLGRIHPGNSLLTHELVGKLSLGINPDEQPRWG